MDYYLFQVINRLSGKNPILDKFMIFLSNKVRYVFMFVFLFLFLRKKFKKDLVKNSLFSIICAWFLHFIIHFFYFKPRPFIKHRVGILIPSKMDSSFPSKHTLLAFAASTSILLREKQIGVVMWILSILTGFSRVWMGHHYPSDIIFSAIIGSITSVIAEISLNITKACPRF